VDIRSGAGDGEQRPAGADLDVVGVTADRENALDGWYRAAQIERQHQVMWAVAASQGAR
jgi:hypothetical protein